MRTLSGPSALTDRRRPPEAGAPHATGRGHRRLRNRRGADKPPAGLVKVPSIVAAVGAVVGLAAGCALTPPTRPFRTASALQSYFATRPGTESVAAYDAVTGTLYAYGPQTRFRTASTIKVAILGALLTQAQGAHRPLTAFEARLGSEMMLAGQMIEYSDNGAADILWNEIGRGPGLAQFLVRVGMWDTVPGPGMYWINTATTAVDLVQLMRAVAYPNSVLSAASRAYILGLMGNVSPSQHWGVSAGAGRGQNVALKNGWVIEPDGWGINSIGRIWGAGRDCVVAALSSGNPTMGVGVATDEAATRVATAGLNC